MDVTSFPIIVCVFMCMCVCVLELVAVPFTLARLTHGQATNDCNGKAAVYNVSYCYCPL